VAARPALVDVIVVDASCLYTAVAGGDDGEAVRARLAADDDQLAPHLIDAEVLGIIRRHHLLGALDVTAAGLAVEDLRDWPGERIDHRLLLDRAWELRTTVRSWDALYVALAEAMGATLITLDVRLARATGPRCPVEVVDQR
jgi:predicted nucleic acid-binding protein